MAREDWFDLKAYVELELYSFHIDSVLLYAAHYAGLEEVVLPGHMQAYHIEHSAGSAGRRKGTSTCSSDSGAGGSPRWPTRTCTVWPGACG